tara:strand:- start:222 stop:491 length:270 start_codon:yes stop_codon:yes gene_type:complete
MTEEKTILSDEQKQALIKKFVEDKKSYHSRVNEKLNRLALPIIQEATLVNDEGEAVLDTEYFVVLMQNILAMTINYSSVEIIVKKTEID